MFASVLHHASKRFALRSQTCCTHVRDEIGVARIAAIDEASMPHKLAEI